METAASELKVAAALMRAQEKFDPILKDTANPYYKSKYATLDQVIAATRPHLRAEGLIILQTNVQDGDRSGIATRLLHVESGEELRSQLLAKPKEDTIQQIAGVLTYCRRYEYHTITGTASEDDDGNTASGHTETEQPRRPQSVQPKEQSNRFYRTSATTTTAVANPVYDTISTPLGTDMAQDSASSAPQPIPVSVQSSVTPTESARSADPTALPTSEQYKAYATTAVEILQQLEKAGLKAGKGAQTTNAKLKKYLSKFYTVADVKQLTCGQWDEALAGFVRMTATPEGLAAAVATVEAANQKEAK